MSKVIFDCTTLVTTRRDLTQSELDYWAALGEETRQAASASVPEQTAYQNAVAFLRTTYNTPRTAAQLNNAIDAVTVILRRTSRELQ